MEGFLLHLSDHTQGRKMPFSVPHLLNKSTVSVEQSCITPHIELHTWGNSQGDIHISKVFGGSLLILFGYITESSYLTDFTTQQEACDCLCQILAERPPENFFPELARSFYGSFTFVYVSNQNEAIYALTDRVGSRPLWYHTSREGIWICSNAIVMAHHLKKKSYRPGAIAAYLLYATAIEPTKSIFSDIASQPEGSLLVKRLRQTVVEKKWYSFKHVPDNNRPVDDWVKLAADRFVMAAKRILRINPKPLLFLSGGIDSRLAGAALIAAGGRPVLCTLSDSKNIEVNIAKAVAYVFDCRHEIIIRDEEYYLRYIKEAVLSSNGAFSWAHSHFRAAYQQQKLRNNTDAAILGDLCEAFSKLLCAVSQERRNVWSTEEFVAEFDSIPLPLYRPINREITLGLLQNDFRREAEKSLKSDIANRYMSASAVSSDPLIVGDYFLRWQNTACIATFQMFNDIRAGGPERNLMFDKDLQQLLEIMPSEIRSKEKLGARIVKYLSPRAALVPNANTMMPLLFPELLQSLAKKAKPRFGKIRRKLFSNTYKTTASWPHLPLLYNRNKSWKNTIEKYLLESSILPEEIFNRSSVALCWDEFCNGNLSRHSDVERLLGMSILSEIL